MWCLSVLKPSFRAESRPPLGGGIPLRAAPSLLWEWPAAHRSLRPRTSEGRRIAQTARLGRTSVPENPAHERWHGEVGQLRAGALCVVGLCAAIFLIMGCAAKPRSGRSVVYTEESTTAAEEEAKRWLEAARRRLDAERRQERDQDLGRKRGAAIRSRESEKERRLEELRQKREEARAEAERERAQRIAEAQRAREEAELYKRRIAEAKRSRQEAEAQAVRAREGAHIVGGTGRTAPAAAEEPPEPPQEPKAVKKKESPRPSSEKIVPAEKTSGMPYRLHEGDELDISVWGHADLNRRVQIEDNGSFSFPLIGEIPAVGRSLPEVTQELQDRLNRDYIVNPQVTLRSVNAKFSVMGEVARPGSYPVEGKMDVLTAISLAGGITKFGSNRADIIRGEGDEKVTIRANMDAIIRGKEANVDILPHDTVYVRRRIF